MSELIGRIDQDGNIVLPKKRLEEIKLLLKGKKIILSFDEFQPKKSRAQLGYFHKGIIGTLSNVTGIAKKKLRNYFNMKFLPDEAVNPKTGEWTTVPGSTSTLKKYEYSNFINEVYLDCLDMGFHEIKTPEEYWDSIGIQPNQPTDSL